MDSTTGGPSKDERQRQTAVEIARKKVLAAYHSNADQYNNPSNYKETPVKTTAPNQTDLKKYHSAWQDYYQKYYSDYYAKAARQYLETEKLKAKRAAHDEATLLAGTNAIKQPAEQEVENIEISLRERIRKKANKSVKNSRRHRRLVPIIAGISVVLIILFLQYNRLIFAPIIAYIAPGNTTVEQISAIDPTVSQAPNANPTLIIPKLNIDVPVNFGISNDNTTVMNAMENGVAQFAIPGANALPGQVGNLVITGHSAGDIYSNNQYKFIFSGLERLQSGDKIYLDYNSTRYTYSVTRMETIEPTNVAALTANDNKPTLVLVTCTPLGTSRYRLLVFADQINPATSETPASSPTTKPTSPQKDLPANEPSLFENIWHWLTGQS